MAQSVAACSPPELVVYVAGGRVLTGRAFGPGAGAPVLSIASAGTRANIRSREGLLASAQVGLLTMNRPAMEDWCPPPQLTLATTVDANRVIAGGAMGEVPVPVVVNSQGSVFGVGAAVTGQVSRLIFASLAGEIAHPAMHSPDHARTLAQRAPGARR